MNGARLHPTNDFFSIRICVRRKYLIVKSFWRWQMANTNLASMSIDALLKLREDLAKVLSRKAVELKGQLRRLDGDSGYKRGDGGSRLKGRKIAVKYRDRSGNTWAGRGAQPVWLREQLKAGAKLEDFTVSRSVASRKASKKRRRAKR